MSAFITTIQLQQAAEKDYEVLNNEMEKASFRLKKTPGKGKKLDIKRAEYNSRKNSSIKEVADAVYRAVKKTGLAFSFTIIKHKHR
jgi:molecular chaperone DnaK (HSP70)